VAHILQLFLLLVIIILASKLAGALANRIGQPAVFGEILAGLLLGPTFLDVLNLPFFRTAPPTLHGAATSLQGSVSDLADLGVLLLMFIAGLETNLAEMRRVGRVAFWSAFGGVVLPLVAGTGLAVMFGLPLFWEALFIGTILTATSVSISAQTLIELRTLRSKEGSTILGAAVIDDVMGIIVLSLVVAFARTNDGVHVAELALILVRMAGFFVAAVLLGRWLERFLDFVDRLGASQGLLSGALVVALLYAWAAEYIGEVAAITGSYIAGVLLAQTRYKKKIDQSIHALTYSMLVPVFFIGIGLQANGRELGSQVVFTVVLVIVAIVSKAVGCAVFARMFGFTLDESLRVGAGMISRGEVGLIVAGYGLSAGIIGRDVFSASVLVVLVTTMVTPPLLRLTFNRGTRPLTEPLEETVAHAPQHSPHH
jgi:Kef-type K+ transport system membrane component KefB